MNFEIAISEKSGTASFRLKGPFGASEVQEFRNAVMPGGQPAFRSVIVDLAGVTQMDGFALASLVRLHQRVVTEAKGKLGLTGINPAVSRLLEVTAMSRVFTIYHTEDEAIRCQT
jgi:anti-sigma B factor antagonist